MSTQAQPDWPALYERVAAHARKVLAGVRADQWALPTPCTDWNVRQLVTHMVSGVLRVRPTMDPPPAGAPPAVAPGADPLAPEPLFALHEASKAAVTALKAPGAMARTVTSFRGPVPAPQYVFGTFQDLLVHTWDLAKATGQDTRLPADLVEADYAIAAGMRERWRASGAFGTEEPRVPDNADTQTKLLALMGRRA